MKTKSLLILIGALAVLSVVAYIVNRPAGPASADPRVGKSVVGTKTIDAAAKITVLNDGKTVTLVANAKKADWRVKQYYDFPVNFDQLTRLTDGLKKAKIDRMVTKDPQRLSRLDLGKEKVTFFGTDGKQLLSISLGRTSDQGERFFSYNGEKKAYEAPMNVYLPDSVKAWAQSKLLPVKSDQVQSFTLDFPNGGSLTVDRKKPATDWTAASIPADKELNMAEVNSALSRFTSLNFTDTSDPTLPVVTEAKRHARHATVKLFDGTTYTIEIGRKPAPPPPPKPAKTASEKNAKTTGKNGKTEKKTPPKPKPGPVYVFIQSSKTDSTINQMMTKRAFKVSDYTYTALPKTVDDLLQAAPPPKKAAKTPPKKSPAPPSKS